MTLQRAPEIQRTMIQDIKTLIKSITQRFRADILFLFSKNRSLHQIRSSLIVYKCEGFLYFLLEFSLYQNKATCFENCLGNNLHSLKWKILTLFYLHYDVIIFVHGKVFFFK